MVILETRKLTKIYGQNNETRIFALDNVNLTVNEEEFISITGPSGSGKSTLLHMLGGLDRVSDGEILVQGVNISTMNDEQISKYRRSKVGFIFQSYNLVPVLNVEDNITLPIRLDKKKIDKEYISEIIHLLGLEERRSHFPNQLSGGQQQRVAIARALANRPAIILADEPTGNLDRGTGKVVLELLECSVKKFNQTLIMITHDPEIAKMADRTIMIEDGKIVS